MYLDFSFEPATQNINRIHCFVGNEVPFSFKPSSVVSFITYQNNLEIIFFLQWFCRPDVLKDADLVYNNGSYKDDMFNLFYSKNGRR